jgi:hypothetical protein
MAVTHWAIPWDRATKVKAVVKAMTTPTTAYSDASMPEKLRRNDFTVLIVDFMAVPRRIKYRIKT